MKREGINLDGLNGLVYLMYLGRETYAGQWKDRFTETGLLKNAFNVDQASKRLIEAGFVKELKTEKKPGAPRLRTSSFEPLFQTIENCGLKLPESKKKRVMEMIKDFSIYMDFFPLEVKNTLKSVLSKESIKNLPWKLILTIFFHFLGKLLIFIKKPELLHASIEEITVPEVALQLGIEPAPKESVVASMEAVKTIGEKTRIKLSKKYDLVKDGQFLLWEIYSYLMMGPYLGKMFYRMSMLAMSKLSEIRKIGK